MQRSISYTFIFCRKGASVKDKLATANCAWHCNLLFIFLSQLIFSLYVSVKRPLFATLCKSVFEFASLCLPMRTTTTAAKFCFVLLSSLFPLFTSKYRSKCQLSMVVFVLKHAWPRPHPCDTHLPYKWLPCHLYSSTFPTLFLYLSLFVSLSPSLFVSACLLRGHWQSFIHKNVNQPKCVLLWVSEWVSSLATAMIGGKSKGKEKQN